ncbi:MAG TPA: S1 RNA-binding domain-containing protein, partial [Rhizomicrobium sp.]
MARAATKERTEASIAIPSREDFAAMLEQSFETQSPQEGSVIKGTIVSIENDFAMVDVGLKTEGRISL